MNPYMHSGGSCSRGAILGMMMLALAVLDGCAPSHPPVNPESEAIRRWIEVVRPVRIKILEWTRPVSFTGEGTADGIEAIVAAYDAFNDETKVAGTFHFELQTRRMSEAIGKRVAYWSIDLDTPQRVQAYIDYPNRFYRFPLQLDQPLRAGRYLLTARLVLPTGEHLTDEYEFDYDGGGAPPVRR